MLLRSTARPWAILVTLALPGCTLNPQGEDPGFDDGSDFENSAGDDIIDEIPGREGETAPMGEPSDSIDLGADDDAADDDGSEIVGEPAPPGEVPPVPMAPEPVVEPEDDVEPAYGDAGALLPTDAGSDAGPSSDAGGSDAGGDAGLPRRHDGGLSGVSDAGVVDASSGTQ